MQQRNTEISPLRCASVEMTGLDGVEESGRAELDTPPFAKSAKGRAPRLCQGWEFKDFGPAFQRARERHLGRETTEESWKGVQ